jgi:hypothetical protein
MLLYQWVWVFLISSSIKQLKMHTYLRSAFSYVLLIFTYTDGHSGYIHTLPSVLTMRLSTFIIRRKHHRPVK